MNGHLWCQGGLQHRAAVMVTTAEIECATARRYLNDAGTVFADSAQSR